MKLFRSFVVNWLPELLLIAIVVATLGWVFLNPQLLEEDSAISAATFVLALVAGFSALMSYRAVYEMRRDRLERWQPVLVFDLEFTPKGVIWLSLKNVGTGVARDISITFDQSPVDLDNLLVADWSWIRQPIPLMAPGANYRQIFQTGVILFSEKSKATPLQFTVTVNYRGDGGVRYAPEFPFDLERIRDMTIPHRTADEHLEDILALFTRWDRRFSKGLPVRIVGKQNRGHS